MRPESIPELAKYPKVQWFVENLLAMQFGDVRSMLRLPVKKRAQKKEDKVENGCNFAAAASLCNLISGISVILFNRAGRKPGRKGAPRDRGKRFKALLTANYYPWQPSENRAQKIDALYDILRNPLAHSLGVLEPGQIPIDCLKTEEGMTMAEVDNLDIAYDGGRSLTPALEMDSGRWKLNVPYFYAAVVEMLRALVYDSAQMTQSEACFGRSEWTD